MKIKFRLTVDALPSNKSIRIVFDGIQNTLGIYGVYASILPSVSAY